MDEHAGFAAVIAAEFPGEAVSPCDEILTLRQLARHAKAIRQALRDLEKWR